MTFSGTISACAKGLLGTYYEENERISSILPANVRCRTSKNTREGIVALLIIYPEIFVESFTSKGEKSGTNISLKDCKAGK